MDPSRSRSIRARTPARGPPTMSNDAPVPSARRPSARERHRSAPGKTTASLAAQERPQGSAEPARRGTAPHHWVPGPGKPPSGIQPDPTRSGSWPDPRTHKQDADPGPPRDQQPPGPNAPTVARSLPAPADRPASSQREIQESPERPSTDLSWRPLKVNVHNSQGSHERRWQRVACMPFIGAPDGAAAAIGGTVTALPERAGGRKWKERPASLRTRSPTVCGHREAAGTEGAAINAQTATGPGVR